MHKEYEIAIVGGGPAGLAAGIYCGRALRKTVILEKMIFGGQIVNADIIENYPGFAEPQEPRQLMEAFQQQAENFGVEMINAEVSGISPAPGNKWLLQTDAGEILAQAIIYAAGSNHKMLHVPGEKELLGRGVSVCATCDAPFFVQKTVAVIGGGDTALVEALHLTKFAAKVFIIHRRNQLRAEKILQQRCFENPKIEIIYDHIVTAFLGENHLQSLMLKSVKTDQNRSLTVDGAFIAIGTVPNTRLLQGLVRLDENGYVITDISLKTDAPGIFVAGEVISGNWRQVAISSGMGVQAALSCEHYLNSLH